MGCVLQVLSNLFVVEGDVEKLRKSPVVIFDLDGVLIDSSERFNKSLEEAGITKEEFDKDPKARGRAWRIFLSEKYIHLDKPVEEAIKLLKERKEKGAVILIITGRPETLKTTTIDQLKRFGIPYDVIVFRSRDNFMKDHKYKKYVLDTLKIVRIIEAHDDSPEVCEMYAKYAEHICCWHSIGNYKCIP